LRVIALCAACVVLAACGQRPSGRLASQEDSVSYIIGYQIGDNLKRQGAPLQPGAILRGLQEGFAGTKPALADTVARGTMMAYQQKAMQAQRVKDSATAESNVSESAKFFADNAKKPGVQTSKSGLQWKVLTEGKGPRPQPTSVVTVHYRGTLLNGEEFDNSYQRGQPAQFELNGVIPGWTEAVGLMNAGAKYQFWIPSALAYGPQGRAPKIGPNAALMFEVELLSFK
jgi:FKBP-type peptidyl-prolyl cis-trans isomerase FklB